MKVVVTGLFGDGFEDSLTTEFPDVDFVFATSEEDQAREIKDADAYMGMPSRERCLSPQTTCAGCTVREQESTSSRRSRRSSIAT